MIRAIVVRTGEPRVGDERQISERRCRAKKRLVGLTDRAPSCSVILQCVHLLGRRAGTSAADHRHREGLSTHDMPQRPTAAKDEQSSQQLFCWLAWLVVR